jgi:L-threonylcarbamoyladenylate synthase
MTVDPPQILRPGGTPYEDLKKILGRVELHPVAVADKEVPIEKARSPGVKHRHYAPTAEVILVEGEASKIVSKVKELVDFYKQQNKRVGVLSTDENFGYYRANVVKSLGSRKNLKVIANNLFRLLREFDSEKVDVIIAEGLPLEGLGLAVMNRLRKAAGYKIFRADA